VSNLALVGVIGLLSGCAPQFEATRVAPLAPDELASFWEDVDPRSRDTFYSVGGAGMQPDPDAVYEVLERDTGGFSTTYDVRDPRRASNGGSKWATRPGRR
jgi:hypothetical protein